MSNQGRIVWHDLNTTDLPRARAFYSELFGWNISGEGQWTFIAPAGEEQHFGTMIEHDPTHGIPSHWVPYLTVGDLDAAAAKVPAAGGRVILPKRPAGSTGQFSYVADAQGAAFALWQYTGGAGKPEHEGAPPLGHFVWDELLTSDPAAAQKFYAEVIGYQAQSSPVPGMDYTLLLREAKGADGKPRHGAGMMKLPPGVPHPFWLSYVFVADSDAAAAKAKTLGATVVQSPMDIPNVGRIATLLDPTQAAFAIISSPK